MLHNLAYIMIKLGVAILELAASLIVAILTFSAKAIWKLTKNRRQQGSPLQTGNRPHQELVPVAAHTLTPPLRTPQSRHKPFHY